MTDQPSIPNEAAFLHALGINPGVVRAGSTNINFESGTPVISLVLIIPKTWDELAVAIAAGQSGKIPEQPKAPGDRKPRKTAAKKP